MFKSVNGGKLPEIGSKYSACVDLFANEDVVIGAGETKIVGLGVTIDEEYIHSFVDEYCGHSYDLRNQGSVDESYNKFCEEKHSNNYTWFLKHHSLQLMLRSSLGKKGLIIPNGVGIIDLDYRDEIKMIIHNPLSKSDFYTVDYQDGGTDLRFNGEYSIKKGDKIAQITLLEHKGYLFGIDTDVERDGGFGSTDKEVKNV